jgi:hypothetical protein
MRDVLIVCLVDLATQAELTGQLDYHDAREPVGNLTGSSRSGVVPKGARWLGGLSAVIISWYAGGMTTRDIVTHLARVYGQQEAVT